MSESENSGGVPLRYKLAGVGLAVAGLAAGMTTEARTDALDSLFGDRREAAVPAPLPEVIIEEVPTTIDTTTTSTTSTILPRIEVDGFRLRTLGEFVSPELLPEGLVEQVTKGALRLRAPNPDGSESWCTGAIVNGLVVSSGHCVPESDPEIMIAANPEDGYKAKNGTIGPRFVDRDYDLMFGRITSDGAEALPHIKIPRLANQAPRPGSRAMMASLAGGVSSPIVAELFFLGPAKYEISDTNSNTVDRWVYAVMPGSNLPCDQGGSGTPVLDGRGSLAVHQSTDRDMIRLSQRWGIDLRQSPGVCITAPVTDGVFHQFASQVG